MTELYVLLDETWYPVSLEQNEQITLTRQFTDLENLQKPSSDFSRTFSLPVDGRNQALFGQIWQSTEIPRFDPRKVMRARIAVEGITIVVGSLQYRESIEDPDGGINLRWVFFSGGATLAALLGDRSLRELDLSAYTHPLTLTTIQQSWMGLLHSGAVRYGLIDKGQNWNTQASTAWSPTNPLFPADFTPFVRLREVFTSIVDLLDIDLDPDFTAQPEFDDIYLAAYGGSPAPVQDANTAEAGFRAVKNGTQNVAAANLNTGLYIPLVLTDAAGQGFDDGTNWEDAGVDPAKWNPPYTGSFQLQVNVTLRPLTTIFTFVQLQLRRVSDSALVGLLDSSNLNGSGSCNNIQLSNTAGVTVSGDEEYFFALYVQTQATGNILQIFGDGLSLGAGCPAASTRAEVLATLTQPEFGFDVDLAANLPDIPIISLLRSCQVLENLVLVPDTTDTARLRLVGWRQFMDEGGQADWADLLDTSRPILLRPTTDLQKNSYLLTYDEGEDFANAAVLESGLRVYGSYSLEGLDESWSSGNLELLTPDLAPYLVTEVEANSGVFIHRMLTTAGGAIAEPKMRLAFWGGMQDAAIDIWVWNDDTSAAIPITQYPFFSHQNAYGAGATADLLFSPDFSTYEEMVIAPVNRWTKNWQRYFDELYGERARILTCHIWLRPQELTQFAWNNRIWLHGDWWRVLKIYAYDPLGLTTTKVDLVKVNDPAPFCEVTPVGVNSQGIVLFEDFLGDPAAATEACCVAYGYSWIGGQCRAFNLPPVTPVPAPPPVGGGGGIGGGGGTGGIGVDPAVPPVGGGSAGGSGGGGGIVIGPNIQLPAATRADVVGQDIEVSGSGQHLVARGRRHSIDLGRGRDSMRVEGVNADGFSEGVHRGGGFWLDSEDGANRHGEAQWGQILLRYDGPMAKGIPVELFVEGKAATRINWPDAIAASLTIDVVVVENNAGSPLEFHGCRFTNAARKRVGAMTYADATAKAADRENGDLVGLACQLSATGSPQQMVLQLIPPKTTVHPVRAVAVITYQMVGV